MRCFPPTDNSEVRKNCPPERFDFRWIPVDRPFISPGAARDEIGRGCEGPLGGARTPETLRQRRARTLGAPAEPARTGGRAAMGPRPRRPPARAGAPARARRPPRLLRVSRGRAPSSASASARPPELEPLAPAAEHASYLLVERDGLVLIVPVLAAVGGTGLHHPSGPPHFPSAREAGGGGGEGRGTGALGARRARLRHARCFRWLWSAVPGAMASPAGG